MYIENGLEGKEDLNIYCKSKDNNLRQHLLHINQSFHWTFETRFFGNTLFFCFFQWKNLLLCCILMYTTKKRISNYLQSVIGIFIKMDHVDMK